MNELPILVDEIDTQDSIGQVYVTRTISTEQWARAATADDTLPVSSLSTLPTTLAPI